jgi:hypothetical protein
MVLVNGKDQASMNGMSHQSKQAASKQLPKKELTGRSQCRSPKGRDAD